MNKDVVQVQQSGEVVTPMAMIQTAVSSGRDVAEIEKLMDLEERWNARQAKQAYLSALSEFQSKCPVIKNLKAGHNYKYAPIGDIVAQVKDLLATCGLSYRFEQNQSGSEITVTCVTTHKDGHSESLSMSATPDKSGSKNDVQAIGSTITYLRRYSFTGAFGIVTADEDSDGRVEAASGITANDKTWVRAIRSGAQTLNDIQEPHYRAHIAELLERAQ